MNTGHTAANREDDDGTETRKRRAKRAGMVGGKDQTGLSSSDDKPSSLLPLQERVHTSVV